MVTQVSIEVPFLTGQEPLEMNTLQDTIKFFWKFFPDKVPILLVPPELKYKAEELTYSIRKDNPISECIFAVILTFRSRTAWVLADKSIIEKNFNK